MEILFRVLSIQCAVCFLYSYWYVFLFPLGDLSSMTLLKIWPMPLTWDSSPSSMPYNWKVCFLYDAPYFHVFLPPSPCSVWFHFFNFSCSLLIWSRFCSSASSPNITFPDSFSFKGFALKFLGDLLGFSIQSSFLLSLLQCFYLFIEFHAHCLYCLCNFHRTFVVFLGHHSGVYSPYTLSS